MRSKTADGAEDSTGMASGLDYVGDPGPCDVCGRPLINEQFFCDAELPAQGGRWGVLCKPCTDGEGAQPGWGRAQFYERLEGSVAGKTGAGRAQLHWRCVGGRPPSDVASDELGRRQDCLDLCSVAGTLSLPHENNQTSMRDDWFSRLTGFNEGTYGATRELLEVNGSTLRSKVNGRSFCVGQFDMTSLADLRLRVTEDTGASGTTRVNIVTGDVRKMHQLPEYAGALFQVASQFNSLEMVGPSITPEDGVTRYDHDRTQGPACAIAAGAATIYRNYFAPVGDQIGQSAANQLDGLADLGAELSCALARPVSDLWNMQNGYALATQRGLDMISAHLHAIGEWASSELAGRLRIGVHQGVEVTDGPLPGQQVIRAFCSALPVAYGRWPQPRWEDFAQLVLNAAYEATLLAGVLNSRQGGSNIVLLTMLGGGAFGNAREWIHTAIRRALDATQGYGLDVRLVSYGPPSAELRSLV